MAKKAKTQFAILGLLALEPRSTGYDIKKSIETSLSHCWREGFGSIYPVLNALEKEGLIQQEKEKKSNKREKIHYSLTAIGSKAFTQWMEEPLEEQQPRNELLLKLFFGHIAPPHVMSNHLLDSKKRLTEKLVTFENIKDMLETHHQKDPGYPYWMMSLDFGIHQAKSALKWTDKAILELSLS